MWVGIEVDGLRHSADGGDSWCKFGREFGKISSLLWVDALD